MFVDYLFPRNPETVKEHIKDTKKLIKLALTLINKYPTDKVVALILEQSLFILRNLAKEYKLSLAFKKAVREEGRITYYFTEPLPLKELSNVLEKLDRFFPHKKSLDCYTAGAVIHTEKQVIASATCIVNEKQFCKLQVEADEESLTVIPKSGDCTVNCISNVLLETLSEIGMKDKVGKIAVNGKTVWKWKGGKSE